MTIAKDRARSSGRAPVFAVLVLAALQKDVPEVAPVTLTARTLAEEELPIRDLVVDAKRSRIITLVENRLLVARDVRSGAQAWRTEGDHLNSLALGRELLVAASVLAGVTTFDLETGAKRMSIGGVDLKNSGTSIVSDPRDRWVWVGTGGGVQRLQPENVNSFSWRPLPNGGVTVLTLAKDGELIAIGNQDGTIRFANSQSANVDKKKEFRGHTGPVTALAFDSKVLFSASEDRTVRAWSLGSGLERFASTEHTAPVRSLAIAPKLDFGASGDDAGTLNVWKLGKGEVVATWKDAGAGAVNGLAFLEKEVTLIAAAGRKLLAIDLSHTERR